MMEKGRASDAKHMRDKKPLGVDKGALVDEGDDETLEDDADDGISADDVELMEVVGR